MKRIAFAATLVFLLGGGGVPTAPGFPGGHTFTGKVKCVTTFDEGSAFSSTDIVTLTFFQSLNSANRQDGMVELTHTETNTAGIYLDDENLLDYTAVLNLSQGSTGLVAISDDGGFLSGVVAEYKAKSDGSIGSLRFVSTHGFDDEIQRCSGTLKRAPLTV
jgi:hypothetical protein